MIPEPLVRSLLAGLIVLEGADDSEIDPEVAVAGMESMAHELQDLAPGEIVELIAVIERIADAEGDAGRHAFCRAVPRTLGLEV